MTTVQLATDGKTLVVVGGDEIVAQAAASARSSAAAAATSADVSAATAAAAARYFMSRALGEAGSTTGQFFSTGDGAGALIYYQKTSGGSTEIARVLTPATLAADDGATKVTFRENSNATPVTTDAKWRKRPIDASDFMEFRPVDEDWTTSLPSDQSAGYANFVAAMLATGREGRWEKGKVRIDTPTPISISDYAAYASAYGTGPRMIGAGQGRTVIPLRATSGAFFDVKTTNTDSAAYKAALGGLIEGFTFIGVTGRACIPIRMRSVSNFEISDIYWRDIKDRGIVIDCQWGDNDASNSLTLQHIRGEYSAGWAVDAVSATGQNENSYLRLQDCLFVGAGTDEMLPISGISRAGTCVITTATTHGYADGERIYVFGGMPELHSLLTKRHYAVKNPNAGARTFELHVVNDDGSLTPVNSSTFAAYGGGGHVMRREPRSGGVRSKCQNFTWSGGGTTESRNAAIHIPGGAGIALDYSLSNLTIENPRSGVGKLIQGVLGYHELTNQFYTRAAFGGETWTCYAGTVLDAGTATISNTHIVLPTLRANSDQSDCVGFVQFGANLDRYTCPQPEQIVWKQWDGVAGQRRLTGFAPPSIGDAGVVFTDGTSLFYQPDPSARSGGCVVPIRLRGPAVDTGGVASKTGEWIGFALPASGVFASNPTRAPSTLYNVYFGEVTRNVPGLIISTTAPAIDPVSGYQVKSDDPAFRLVGRWATDGTGAFITTDTGWLWPTLIASKAPGTAAFQWLGSDNKPRIRYFALPANGADYTWIGS